MPVSAGPDLVVAGAARCGTSYLAASLTAHPAIDGGAVKEPNFFSREYSRGFDWYDGLFEPRRAGLVRLDASMSFTVPQHPESLGLLAAASPDAFVIYAVRDPLVRAVSHYRLLRHYKAREEAATFGEAIRTNPVYLGASDYERWLSEIFERFPRDRVLVAPFELVTGGDEVTTVVFEQLGLPSHHADDVRVGAYRNEVVEFRSGAVRSLRRLASWTGTYPVIRRRLGPDRMRRLRARATRTPEPLPVPVALGSCTSEQRAEIQALVSRSCSAVTAALRAQDDRLGLGWASAWQGASGSDVNDGAPPGS